MAEVVHNRGAIRRGIIHRDGPIVEIVTHPRRENPAGYKFPPLMDDARSNHYASVAGEGMTAYLKPVAGPYTGEHGVHMMVIPDAHPNNRGERANIPGIKDLSPIDLGLSINMAVNVANAILQQPGIHHIDLGLHSSPEEKKGTLKQRLNTFPDNVHIHVTGYDRRDIPTKSIPLETIAQDSDFLGRTGEALQSVTQEIFAHEIINREFGDSDAFHRLFRETRDARGRLRYTLVPGTEGFQDEALPTILQTIDRRAGEVYQDIGKCFFAYDAGTNKFVEDANDHNRYALLPEGERAEKIEEYIEERKDWLSPASQTGLRLLTRFAKTAQEILDRERVKGETDESKIDYRSDTADKIAANRFWAHKGPAYTMVFSAEKIPSGSTEWTFGFDAKVFTVEGVPQSSPVMDKIITKQVGAFPEGVMHAIQEREAHVVGSLLERQTVYQVGTTTPDKV